MVNSRKNEGVVWTAHQDTLHEAFRYILNNVEWSGLSRIISFRHDYVKIKTRKRL